MTKFSDDVTQGVEKSAARAMLRAVGNKDEDFQKFQDLQNVLSMLTCQFVKTFKSFKLLGL